jgi:hypothetical protein
MLYLFGIAGTAPLGKGCLEQRKGTPGIACIKMIPTEIVEERSSPTTSVRIGGGFGHG